MRLSYQHANRYGGNESTLLRFTTADGTQACVLVDAGEDVDLDSLLDDDEYLNAILCTHAHIDHYRSLARNVRHSAPIYAAPATARALECALPTAKQDNDLGDVSAALDALEPIDDWTSILGNLDVRPVPAGHAPGASGFVLRFRDANGADDPLAVPQHVLVTGDFTTRPCGGYPGLPTSYPFDVDAILLNVSTDDAGTEPLTESIRTILERAYAGSRVVVATGSLTGVQYAALLARTAAELERELPITVVGQAAKLYATLGYDQPNVAAREVFDRTASVLENGGVTIAGPHQPTTGSSRRLYRAIEDDPAATFVRLGGDAAAVDSAGSCTTRAFPLSTHPTLETLEELVTSLAPMEVVIKHARGDALNAFQRRFDRCFAWGTNDSKIHRLYEDSTWLAPEWIRDRTATRIRHRRWEAVQSRSLDPAVDLPAVERDPIDPVAEGVDLDSLAATFSRPVGANSTRRTGGEPTPDDTAEPAIDGADSSEPTAPQLECVGDTVSARVLTDGTNARLLELLEDLELEAGAVVDVRIERRSESPE